MPGPRKSLTLTPAEEEVLGLMVFGKSNGDIAQVLGKSALTVKGQVASIISKLDAENRTQAVAKHLAPWLFKG
jgi:LuxR family transcriptional regulator, maltose regulon positive regulatory protein